MEKIQANYDSLTASTSLHIESSSGVYHTLNLDETNRFSEIINSTFQNDPDLKDLLPLQPNSSDLFTAAENGILMCKLVNSAVQDTIDESKLNKKKNMNIFQKTENINLAIAGAKKIGCILVNMTAKFIFERREHIILGFIWQLMRIKYLSKVNLKQVPYLFSLKDQNEKESDFLKLSPEQLLLRWFNYHLDNCEIKLKITNFSNDMKDALAYTYLLNHLQPEKCENTGLNLDIQDRAEKVVMNSKNLGVETPIRVQDIVAGNAKLNLLFCAQIFNINSGLKPPAAPLTLPPSEIQEIIPELLKSTSAQESQEIKKMPTEVQENQQIFETVKVEEQKEPTEVLHESLMNQELEETKQLLVQKQVSFKETKTIEINEGIEEAEHFEDKDKTIVEKLEQSKTLPKEVGKKLFEEIKETFSFEKETKSKKEKKVKSAPIEDYEKKMKKIESELLWVKGFCWWCILLRGIFVLIFFMNGYNHLSKEKEDDSTISKIINGFIAIESILAVCVVLYCSHLTSETLKLHLFVFLILFGGCIPNIIFSGNIERNINMNEILVNLGVLGGGLILWQKDCWVCKRKLDNK